MKKYPYACLLMAILLMLGQLTSNAQDIESPVATIDPVTPSTRTSALEEPILIRFNEPVTGVDITDFMLIRNNNTVISLDGLTVNPGPGYYTLDLSGVTATDGSYVLLLTVNFSIRDAALNPLIEGTSMPFVIDQTPPTVDLLDVTPDPRNTPLDSVVIQFDEPVTGVDLADFGLLTKNGSPVSLHNALLTGSGQLYLLNLKNLYLVDDEYLLSLTAADSGIQDLAGHNLLVGTSDTFTLDFTRPAVVIQPVTPSPRNVAVQNLTIQFSEDVTGVQLSNFYLYRDNVWVPMNYPPVQGSGSTYTLNLNNHTWTSGTYWLALDVYNTAIRDTAGNLLSQDQLPNIYFTVDLTPTTGDIIDIEPDPRTSAVDDVAIHFSRAVDGLTSSDLTLTRNGAPVDLTGLAITSLNDDPSQYSFDLTNYTQAEGDYLLSVNGTTVFDTMGGTVQETIEERFRIDRTAPAVTLSVDEHGLFHAVLSEPVLGFTQDDVATTNGRVGSFASDSPTSYSFCMLPVDENPVEALVPADSFTDGALNSNQPSNTISRQYPFFVDYGYFAEELPVCTVLADFDGDGHLDIATGSYFSGVISLYYNDGQGGFQGPYSQTVANGIRIIKTGDLDGDGNIDLIFGSRYVSGVQVMFNDGNGSFGSPRQILSGGIPYDIQLVDLNGDGQLDIAAMILQDTKRVANTVAASGPEQKKRATAFLSVSLNQGGGQFGSPQFHLLDEDILMLTAGDYDGDGDIDLATGSYRNDSIIWLPNQGDGSFGEPQTVATGYYIREMVSADVDQDGDLDLVASDDWNQGMLVVKNNGDGTFAAPQAYALPGWVVSFVLYDQDLDGDLDLAVTVYARDLMALFVNQGDGSFKWTDCLGVEFGLAMAAGDLDGDEDPDLVVTSEIGDDLIITLKNNLNIPRANIEPVTPALRNAPLGNLAITFSEAVTGVDIADFSLTRNAQPLELGAVALTGAGSAYAVDLAGATSLEGQYTFSFNPAQSGITDSDGHAPQSIAQTSFTVDLTSPTAAFAPVSPNPSSSPVGALALNFSEPVAGVDAADFSITRDGQAVDATDLNASMTSDTVCLLNLPATAYDSGDYVVILNAAGSGIADLAGNTLATDASIAFTVDMVKPQVTLDSPVGVATNLSSIPVTVTFTEPVADFTLEDVSVDNGTISGFSGSGSSYTFNLIPAAEGQCYIYVDDAVAHDAAGNYNYSDSIVFYYGITPPQLNLESSCGGLTKDPLVSVFVVFNQDVLDFWEKDVELTNATMEYFFGSGNLYVFNIRPIAQGPVTIKLPAGAAFDVFGNPNESAQLSFVYDSVAPQFALSTTAGNPATVAPIPVNITVNEDGFGFGAEDLRITNGEYLSFDVTGNHTYQTLIRPKAEGPVTIIVPAGVYQDYTGNLNETTATLTVTYDMTVSAKVSNPADQWTVDGRRVLLQAELLEGQPADVRMIDYQYRQPAGSGEWIAIEPATPRHNPDPHRPWFIYWDTTGLPTGACEVRAVVYNLAQIADAQAPVTPLMINRTNPNYWGGLDANSGQLAMKLTLRADQATTAVTAHEQHHYLLKLAIPAGAVDQDTTLSLQWLHDSTDPKYQVADSLPIYGSLLATAAPGGELAFAAPVTLVIDYAENNNNDFLDDPQGEEYYPEFALQLMQYDPMSGRMVELEGVAFDEENNRITATLTRLTALGLYGIPVTAARPAAWEMYE